MPCATRVCGDFKPGKRTATESEIKLEHLDMVSRKDVARRNSIWTRNPELGKLVQLRGQITRQVNRIAKEARA